MAQNKQHSIGSNIEKYREQVIANNEKTYSEYPSHTSAKTEE